MKKRSKKVKIVNLKERRPMKNKIFNKLNLSVRSSSQFFTDDSLLSFFGFFKYELILDVLFDHTFVQAVHDFFTIFSFYFFSVTCENEENDNLLHFFALF